MKNPNPTLFRFSFLLLILSIFTACVDSNREGDLHQSERELTQEMEVFDARHRPEASAFSDDDEKGPATASDSALVDSVRLEMMRLHALFLTKAAPSNALPKVVEGKRNELALFEFEAIHAVMELDNQYETDTWGELPKGHDQRLYWAFGRYSEVFDVGLKEARRFQKHPFIGFTEKLEERSPSFMVSGNSYIGGSIDGEITIVNIEEKEIIARISVHAESSDNILFKMNDTEEMKQEKLEKDLERKWKKACGKAIEAEFGDVFH